MESGKATNGAQQAYQGPVTRARAARTPLKTVSANKAAKAKPKPGQALNQQQDFRKVRSEAKGEQRDAAPIAVENDAEMQAGAAATGKKPFFIPPMAGMPGDEFLVFWEQLSDEERRARPNYGREKFHYWYFELQRCVTEMIDEFDEEEAQAAAAAAAAV